VRVVALLLLFAAAFGLAGLWQSHHLNELRRERELEQRVQDGEIGRTQSGLIERGHAVVVIGRPAGVEATEVAPAGVETQVPLVAPTPAPVTPTAPPALADFTLTVQPGQTLSEIARAHYGTAPRQLVDSLAAYNHLASADALKAGAKIELPPLDKLQH
jgi:LysM repeat protein